MNPTHRVLRAALACAAALAAGCAAPASLAPAAGPASLQAVPEQPFAHALRASTLYVTSAKPKDPLWVSLSATSSGTVSPKFLVQGARTQLAEPQYAALDPSGRLWTTNCAQGTGASPISAYATTKSGDAAPAATIVGKATGLSSCTTGIAIDAKGDVYAADWGLRGPYRPGQLLMWTAKQTGNAAPTARIYGSKADLHAPAGVALDGKGFVYVADSCFGFGCTGDVRVFSASAKGNVAPVRVISGPGISEPNGLAIDAKGYLYVANAGGAGSITVFAPGASGKAKPVRTIAGSATHLQDPAGIAVDGAGYIYVGNQFDFYVYDPSVLIFPPGANGNAAPVKVTLQIAGKPMGEPSGIAVR